MLTTKMVVQYRVTRKFVKFCDLGIYFDLRWQNSYRYLIIIFSFQLSMPRLLHLCSEYK